ncbi:hypothetical protein [Ktedonobacter racemifer]|uniref:Uncharacterized protein n=1 Tax=Ktedonobacter racemifer DSM 44963 TaxID=485913 RepID=D6TXS8_KTERA|nr:hypothetical protein [Ktedonobacter racemifer]EFH83125.1 hypothetical protein Krac_4058 [Ktedonobacter racemifer DSM 44963]
MSIPTVCNVRQQTVGIDQQQAMLWRLSASFHRGDGTSPIGSGFPWMTTTDSRD